MAALTLAALTLAALTLSSVSMYCVFINSSVKMKSRHSNVRYVKLVSGALFKYLALGT